MLSKEIPSPLIIIIEAHNKHRVQTVHDGETHVGHEPVITLRRDVRKKNPETPLKN
jgi:hypothetical protein